MRRRIVTAGRLQPVGGLILGPMLRFVAETEATIWVETEAPCEVEVLGHTARTFHVEGHHDALYALAHRLRDLPRDEWPDVLLMIGDQVYVDEDAPTTREFIRSRRDTSVAPFDEVADFEEYTRLYWETWGEPVIRWLFSSVP